MMVLQNLAEKVRIRNSRWPPCPYMVKPFKRLLLQNYWADMADILQKAYGAPPYIKEVKSFRLDHKQTLRGQGKFGKNDVKFLIHGPFELES